MKSADFAVELPVYSFLQISKSTRSMSLLQSASPKDLREHTVGVTVGFVVGVGVAIGAGVAVIPTLQLVTAFTPALASHVWHMS